MRHKLYLFLLLMIIPLYVTGQDWQLVWSDEFDGDSLNLEKWSYQTGTGSEYGLVGWGNNELQYYREENVSVNEGMLTIQAKDETYGGKSYTSGRIRTLDKGDWRYCRIEFRAKMPLGKGLWAAIWMLPSDNVYGGWAASGEIDIMEYLGEEPARVHGTLHFGKSWPGNQSKGTARDLTSGDYHTEFHDFAFEWLEGEMRWYVDDTLYQTLGVGDWWTDGGDFPAPFDQQFHLLFNLAVGGNWPGSPDSSTGFPQDLVIDYIRIYQDLSVGTEQRESSDVDGSGLHDNFPNPFHKTTTISYSLEESEYVTLEVYDVTARKIKTLVDEHRQPGTYHVSFDGSDLSPGLYTYKLSMGTYRESKHMVLLNN